MHVDTRDKTVIRGIGFCGFGCGANTAHVDVRDGKILRIRPMKYDDVSTSDERNEWSFKARGKTFNPGDKTLLPPLSIAYKKRIYSENRILYPLKRVDWDPHGERNPQSRGQSSFERISWDEACDLIASEIIRIHEIHGPLAILAQCDGHGETKIIHATHGAQVNLLDLIGGYTLQARQPDSWEGWYWGAKHVWGMEPVGKQVNQQNLFKDISENSDAVLFWGCDAECTPWGWGGQQPSRLCYWFEELGIESIFVSPDLNHTGACHKGTWIPVLPNTDAALQLAIAYVWMTEGIYDKEFVQTHCIGFDWFEYYVLGREDGIAKTPKWAELKCGVPSYTIKALARYWATHAVAIAHANGGGYIRSCFAHEPARLEVCLLAMQGVGKPGTGQLNITAFGDFGYSEANPLPRSTMHFMIPDAYHGWMEVISDAAFIPKTLTPRAIHNEVLSWYGHVICTCTREDQFKHFTFNGEETPKIRMIWSDSPCWTTCWNGGFLMQDALRSEQLEFILVQHPWMENDCFFADIILPVNTMFEEKDIACDNWSGQYNMLYIHEEAIAALGESRSDYEAVIEIARKLEEFGGIYEGLVRKYTSGLDIDGFIERGFATSGGEKFMSFEEFKEKGICIAPTATDWENDPVGLSKFYEKPESKPMQTPSGKIEFYSLGLAEHFPEDKERPIVPHWIEESDEHKERISSERALRYPFLMISNHPRWRVHAQGDDITWFREIETCKIQGPDGYLYEPLWINPLDAGKLGIEDGDIVRIYNERGSVLGGAYVTERIMPGAVNQDHGARVDSIELGYGGLDRAGANNLICPDATTSKNCVGEVTNGFLVNIEKIDVISLAHLHPHAFSKKYDNGGGISTSTYMVSTHTTL